jgi:hypothetical protein
MSLRHAKYIGLLKELGLVRVAISTLRPVTLLQLVELRQHLKIRCAARRVFADKNVGLGTSDSRVCILTLSTLKRIFHANSANRKSSLLIGCSPEGVLLADFPQSVWRCGTGPPALQKCG